MKDCGIIETPKAPHAGKYRLVPFGTRWRLVETNESHRNRVKAYHQKRRTWWARWFKNDPDPIAISECAARDTAKFFYGKFGRNRRIFVTAHLRNQ